MEVLLKRSWEGIDGQEWDRLVESCSTQTVFQTYAWHLAWWKNFGDGKKLFLVVVHDKKRLLAAAPLAIVKKGRFRILKFIGTGHSDYCDFIYGQGNTAVLSGIFEGLSKNKELWDAMALDYIPQQSPTIAMMESLSINNGLFLKKYSQLPCPAIILDKDKDFIPQLIEKKSLQRHHRHFKAREGYQVLHLKEWKDIAPWLDGFFKQHIQRWGGTKDKSLFCQEENKQFYRTFICSLCAEGRIIFTVIQSQGHAIAFHVGLTYNKTFIWYKPSFDIAVSKYSPGEVLLRELIIYAADYGFDEFDFSIGQEPFKLRFANSVRQNISFKVFKSKRDDVVDDVFSMAKRLIRK